MNENDISRFFGSRGFTVVAFIAMIAATVYAAVYHTADLSAESLAGNGLLYGSAETWLSNATEWVVASINIGVIALTAVMMIALNKSHNFIRSVTSVFASSYILFQLSHPQLITTAVCTGNLMSMIVVWCANILFSAYRRPRSERSILIVMAIVTTGVLTHYAFALLLPVFFLGFAQMQTLNLRTFIAALIGIVTPLWIVFGFGWAHPSLIMPMELLQSMNSAVGALTLGMVISAGVVVLFTLMITATNLLRIINYRLQIRLYNIFFVLLALVTMVALVVDVRHLTAYLPILHLALAMQVGLSYTLLENQPRRYVLVLIILLYCAACVFVTV